MLTLYWRSSSIKRALKPCIVWVLLLLGHSSVFVTGLFAQDSLESKVVVYSPKGILLPPGVAVRIDDEDSVYIVNQGEFHDFSISAGSHRLFIVEAILQPFSRGGTRIEISREFAFEVGHGELKTVAVDFGFDSFVQNHLRLTHSDTNFETLHRTLTRSDKRYLALEKKKPDQVLWNIRIQNGPISTAKRGGIDNNPLIIAFDRSQALASDNIEIAAGGKAIMSGLDGEVLAGAYARVRLYALDLEGGLLYRIASPRDELLVANSLVFSNRISVPYLASGLSMFLFQEQGLSISAIVGTAYLFDYNYQNPSISEAISTSFFRGLVFENVKFCIGASVGF